MKRVPILLAALFVSTSGLAALADTYTVDPVHSSAVFRIRHNNVSYFYGTVTPGPEGTIIYDASKPEASSFDVTVKVANIQTGNPNRDNHLKSPTFFNVKDFPTMTFKSTSVKKGEGNTLAVTGDLTIHNVKKSVTVNMELTGEAKDQRGNPLVGFEGTFNIKRGDFDMKEMTNIAGDDVRIIISLEADKK
jgi:polyisoprenoid-binding protein YceI